MSSRFRPINRSTFEWIGSVLTLSLILVPGIVCGIHTKSLMKGFGALSFTVVLMLAAFVIFLRAPLPGVDLAVIFGSFTLAFVNTRQFFVSWAWAGLAIVALCFVQYLYQTFPQ